MKTFLIILVNILIAVFLALMLVNIFKVIVEKYLTLKVRVYNNFDKNSKEELIEKYCSDNVLLSQITTYKISDNKKFNYKEYDVILSDKRWDVNEQFRCIIKDLSNLNETKLNESYTIITESKQPNFNGEFLVIMTGYTFFKFRFIKVSQVLNYKHISDYTKDEYLQMRADNLFDRVMQISDILSENSNKNTKDETIIK